MTDSRTAEVRVDDARQGVNTGGVEKYNHENESDITLIQAATMACRGFERYLTLTGGGLALDIMMYHVLLPDMRGVDKRYLGGRDIETEIKLNENFKDPTEKLNMYQPNEARKILRCMQTLQAPYVNK